MGQGSPRHQSSQILLGRISSQAARARTSKPLFYCISLIVFLQDPDPHVFPRLTHIRRSVLTVKAGHAFAPSLAMVPLTASLTSLTAQYLPYGCTAFDLEFWVSTEFLSRTLPSVMPQVNVLLTERLHTRIQDYASVRTAESQLFVRVLII